MTHELGYLCKLRSWVPIEKLVWEYVASNPNAIRLLENQICIHYWSWYYLSINPNAIHLLEKNPEKINWYRLSENPSAIRLLEDNPHKIDWGHYLRIQTRFIY